MERIFINLEEENVCLYELEINEDLNEIMDMILSVSPHVEIDEEKQSFAASENQIIDDKKIIKFVISRKTEDEYINSYFLYDLIPLYSIIQKIEGKDYQYLEYLANFTKENNTSSISQKVFNGYKEKILNSLKLNLLDRYESIDQILKLLYLKSKSSLDIKDIPKYISVYKMNLFGLKIIDKTQDDPQIIFRKIKNN